MVVPWSYGRWIYSYLCHHCLSPLMLWIRISIRARCITFCDKVCHWLVIGRWFSPGPPVSSTNKTDSHNIIEILLKVALNTIKQTIKRSWWGVLDTTLCDKVLLYIRTSETVSFQFFDTTILEVYTTYLMYNIL